jgi:hypothetical protein
MGGKPLYMKIELTRRQAVALKHFIVGESWRTDTDEEEALDDIRAKIEQKLNATQE